MDLNTMAARIGAEWAVIASAPFSFVAAIAVSALAIWWLVQREFATRLLNASSTIQLKNDTIQDYKEKLSGATPEQAKEKITELENQVNNLHTELLRIGGPKIPESAKSKIHSLLSKWQGRSVKIEADMTSDHANRLMDELVRVFANAGWLITRVSFTGVKCISASGVDIQISNPNNMTGAQISIASAIEAAG